MDDLPAPGRHDELRPRLERLQDWICQRGKGKGRQLLAGQRQHPRADEGRGQAAGGSVHAAGGERDVPGAIGEFGL